MQKPSDIPWQPLAGPKARGTPQALAHRFERDARASEDDGWPQDDEAAVVSPATTVRESRGGSILTRNNSPDIGFDLSVNPYRGCEHGCIYCYARPTHSYLDLSPGLDFETQLMAKMDAPALLRQALASPRYQPAGLCIGTATDAYQPIERRLRLTRACIEVLAEAQHPFSLVTKSSAVERDLDLLAPLAEQGLVLVHITLTTLDAELARRLEPRASAPARRLQCIARLARAGLKVGVSVSPLIPFLNEPELERILEAARDAGARRASCIPLRLPWEVAPLFEDWLQRHVPERAARILARVREQRGGALNDSRFHSRFKGEGVWAELRAQRFRKACERLGLSREPFVYDFSRFRRPAPGGQPRQEALF